ncbi:hypothetical protein FOA52_009702, partial [Chlamydomonas sp. UWO 241]
MPGSLAQSEEVKPDDEWPGPNAPGPYPVHVDWIGAGSEAGPLDPGFNKDAVMIVRLAQRLVGWLIGLGTSAFL